MKLIAILLMTTALVLLYHILKGWYGLKIKKFRKSNTLISTLFLNFNKISKNRNRRTGKLSLTPKQKGDRFENFVTTLLPKSDGFKLLEWRGDKFHAGVYANSNRYPDLEYEYQSTTNNYKFALECKWRSAFSNGTIKLCEPHQLNIYKEFARTRKLPVFVLLGVGGQPDSPAEMFVIPLNSLSVNFIKRVEIQCYRRQFPLAKFVFDGSKLKEVPELQPTLRSA